MTSWGVRLNDNLSCQLVFDEERFLELIRTRYPQYRRRGPQRRGEDMARKAGITSGSFGSVGPCARSTWSIQVPRKRSVRWSRIRDQIDTTITSDASCMGMCVLDTVLSNPREQVRTVSVILRRKGMGPGWCDCQIAKADVIAQYGQQKILRWRKQGWRCYIASLRRCFVSLGSSG